MQPADSPVTHKIYSLTDPRTGEVRYIGVTIQSLNRRLCCHMGAARRGEETHRARWIRVLLRDNVRPVVTLLEETHDRSREIYWIQTYRKLGTKLTNATDGGEGLLNASDETKAKLSKASKAMLADPAMKAKRSKILKALWRTEEFRNKVIASNTGKKRSEQAKENIRQSHLGHHWNKGAKWPDEARARRKGTRKGIVTRSGPHSEETKQKISAANKGRLPSAETRLLWSQQRKGVKRGPYAKRVNSNPQTATLQDFVEPLTIQEDSP